MRWRRGDVDQTPAERSIPNLGLGTSENRQYMKPSPFPDGDCSPGWPQSRSNFPARGSRTESDHFSAPLPARLRTCQWPRKLRFKR